MKRVLSLSILVAIVVLSGCATVFLGNIRTIPVSSTPDGAEVYINGQFKGTTPLTLTLNNTEAVVWNVEMKKAGYKDVTFTLNRNIRGGMVVLDVILGLVPVVVDAATGAWYDIYPTSVSQSFVAE